MPLAPNMLPRKKHTTDTIVPHNKARILIKNTSAECALDKS